MVKQSIYLLFEKILKLGVVLIVGVFCAREYEREVFGYYSLVLAINGVLYGVISFGLESILIKRRVRSRYWKETFFLSLLIRVLFSVFFSVLIFLFSIFDLEQTVLKGIFILSLANVFYSAEVFTAKYKAEEDNLLPTIVALIVYLIGGALKLYIVFLSIDITYLFWVSVFEAMFYSLFIIGLNKSVLEKCIPLDKRVFIHMKKTYKLILMSASPLLLTSMLSVLYMRVDQFFISYYSGVEQLASYSAASRLIEVGYVFIGVIASAFFPKVIKVLQSSNVQKTDNYRFKQCYMLAWGIGLVLLVFYVFIVAPLSTVIYGDKYEDSYWLVVILALGMPIVALRNFSGKIFITLSFYRHVFYRSILGLVVNIVFNFIFVPYYGVYGAAMSTILSLVVVVFIYDLFINELKFNNKLKFMVFK